MPKPANLQQMVRWNIEQAVLRRVHLARLASVGFHPAHVASYSHLSIASESRSRSLLLHVPTLRVGTKTRLLIPLRYL